MARSLRKTTTTKIISLIIEDNMEPLKAAALAGVSENRWNEYLKKSEKLKNNIDRAIATRDLKLLKNIQDNDCRQSRWIMKHLYPTASIAQRQEKEEPAKKIYRKVRDPFPNKKKEKRKTTKEISEDVDTLIKQEKQKNKDEHDMYATDIEVDMKHHPEKYKDDNGEWEPHPLYEKLCNHYFSDAPTIKKKIKPVRILKRIRRKRIGLRVN